MLCIFTVCLLCVIVCFGDFAAFCLVISKLNGWKMGFRSSDVTWRVNTIPPFGSEVPQRCVSGHCPAVRWSTVLWAVRDLVGFMLLSCHRMMYVLDRDCIRLFLSLCSSLICGLSVPQDGNRALERGFLLRVQILELCVSSRNLWCVFKSQQQFSFLRGRMHASLIHSCDRLQSPSSDIIAARLCIHA